MVVVLKQVGTVAFARGWLEMEDNISQFCLGVLTRLAALCAYNGVSLL